MKTYLSINVLFSFLFNNYLVEKQTRLLFIVYNIRAVGGFGKCKNTITKIKDRDRRKLFIGMYSDKRQF